MSDWGGFAWLFVLLAVNAFFVASEFAVVAVRRAQIEPLAERGNRRAKRVLYGMEHANGMIATSQLGVTVCSLLILNVSEPAIHHLIEIPLYAWGVSAPVTAVLAFVVALVFVSFLHVVFGEIVPKNVAFSSPTLSALIFVPLLIQFDKFFKPLVALLNGCSNAILRMFRVEPKNEAVSAFTLEEVANIVEHSTREGVLQDPTGTVNAAFEFTEKKVRDVMITQESLICLPPRPSAADVETKVMEYGFSRYFVTDDQSEPIGYLHIKDILGVPQAQWDKPLSHRQMRRLVTVHADDDVEDALAIMRRSGAHIGRVYDQQKLNVGVLFLEDIIEELVGEIHDATRKNKDQNKDSRS